MSAFFGPGGNSANFAKAGHKSSLDAPAWVKEYGLDAYEYQGGNGISASLETFTKIGLAAKAENIKLSLHAPYYISLSGIEPEKRLGSIKYILQSVSAAHAMGAGIIVIHCGSASKISRTEAVELAKDTLSHALDEVDNLGISDVSLGIETMGKVNQLGTLDEVLEICASDKRLKPVVDFGHLNARDGGSINSADDYKRIFNQIAATLGDEYADKLHCHFSKIEFTAGGEKRHLTFDDCEFGPSPELLVKAIKELNVSPTIICESAGEMDRDALFMKNLYTGSDK